MKHIIEMVELLTQEKRRWVGIINFAMGRKGARRRFFDAVRRGDVHSDDEAAQFLFGCLAREARYCTQKSRFIDALLDAILLLSFSGQRRPAYKKAALSCKRWQAILGILELFEMPAAAYFIVVHRLLPKAREYSLTAAQLDCYEFLRNYHALRGNSKHCGEMRRHAEQVLEAFNAEVKARALFDQLQCVNASTAATAPQHASLALEAAKEVAEMRTRFNTRTLNLMYFRLKALAHQLKGEYAHTIDICEEALAYLQSNPALCTGQRLAEFQCKILVCGVFTKNFSKGEANARAALQNVNRFTSRWHLIQLMTFILCLHTNRLERAIEIFIIILDSQKRDALPERLEFWRIAEVYLRMALTQSDELSLPGEITLHGSSFSVGRYLEEVPLYRRDKRGLNIMILLAQLFFLLRARQFDLLEYRINAMREYAKRHLKGHGCARTEVIIRMLAQMRDNNYSHNAVLNVVRSNLALLMRTPTHPALANLDTLELLPYETLWAMIMRELHAIQREGSIAQPDNRER